MLRVLRKLQFSLLFFSAPISLGIQINAWLQSSHGTGNPQGLNLEGTGAPNCRAADSSRPVPSLLLYKPPPCHNPFIHLGLFGTCLSHCQQQQQLSGACIQFYIGACLQNTLILAEWAVFKYRGIWQKETGWQGAIFSVFFPENCRSCVSWRPLPKVLNLIFFLYR